MHRHSLSRPPSSATGTVTPAEMLRRAGTWLTADNGSQVPYSQNSVWSAATGRTAPAMCR